MSNWSRVVSGVPHGSTLGPLLFLVYVNDIGDNLTSHSRLFADDSVIYRKYVRVQVVLLCRKTLQGCMNGPMARNGSLL